MRKKRKLEVILCILMCIFIGAVAILEIPVTEDEQQGYVESIWNYSSTEYDDIEKNSAEWNLLSNIESQQVSIDGKIESTDYPYGYNVGYIEDEQVGKAVLLTPGTAIQIEDLKVESVILNIEYIIHPWVAEASDGLIFNISVYGGDGKKQQFEYDVEPDSEKQGQDIILEEFQDEKVCIDICVTNQSGKSEECDWLVLSNFSFEEEASANRESFAAEGYVKSATYFSDEWPLNFWNSEMDDLESELQQIKKDGFDSIIIVIPWREFQPEISPNVYNDYAFENLDKVMKTSEALGLDVYARIGYNWDYYQDEEDNIVERYLQLLGNSDVQKAWYAYVEKMYTTLSSYGNFKEGFLTWEDFWNTLGVCDEISEDSRREKAAFIGYQAWVACNYALVDYNNAYGVNYNNYGEIAVPQRNEPAMKAMYAFYDDFLNTLLKKSQEVFPNLSMEVRTDYDVIYKKDGSTDYFKHTETFSCVDSEFTATMYGIPMGFENIGERVSYTEAMEKTEYILQQLKLQNGGKPVYVEQFIFADNTPKFKNNAQIKEEDLNKYLENVAGILLENSEGYGIWTYRNYRANMFYNSQFALNEQGWKCSDGVEFITVNESNACKLEANESIEQKISKIRNHFDAEEYIFELEVLEVEVPGVISITVGDENKQVKIEETGTIALAFPKSSAFDAQICVAEGSMTIDNVNLYSQIQQGYLYDENNNELECIIGIRTLNSKLEQGE